MNSNRTRLCNVYVENLVCNYTNNYTVTMRAVVNSDSHYNDYGQRMYLYFGKKCEK